MIARRWVLFACLAAPPICVSAAALADAPTTQPGGDGASIATTAPSAAIDALIDDLGADDPSVRDDATQKLLALGPAALPEIQAAASSDDPETSARARSLVRRLTHRRPPGGTHIRGVTQVQLQGAAGDMITDVQNGNQFIHIRQNGSRISMHVSFVENGQESSEDYSADSPQELRQYNPEAYILYTRWGRDRFGAINLRNGPNGGIVRMVIAPPPGGDVDDLDSLRKRISDAMDTAKMPEDQKNRVLDALDAVQDQRDMGFVAKPADYVAACDALRKILADLNLPDPGQTLPPPASVRLGVSLEPAEMGPNDAGFVINTVDANSRGDKIGLKPGDVIQKINGQRINSIKDLRKIVTDHATGLIVEGQRGGQPLKLQETDRAASN